MGLAAGVGRYFGRSHIAEVIAEYDMFVGMSIRYRYEFHNDSKRIAYGPIVGMKLRVLNPETFYQLHPIFDKDQVINSPFFEIGGMIGFSLTQSMIVIETILVTNTQTCVFVNAGVHFFL